MKISLRAHLLVVGLALVSSGWDTHGYYDGAQPQWTSMFAGPLDTDYEGLWAARRVRTELLTGNEHAELAHLALLQLGWRDGLYAREMPAMNCAITSCCSIGQATEVRNFSACVFMKCRPGATQPMR